MKKLLILCAALMMLIPSYAQQEHSRKAFSNLGISLNSSITGAGFTLSTPLAKRFVLRAGYQFPCISYGYEYDDFAPISIGNSYVDVPELDLTAKLKVGAGHLTVDWIPFKKGEGKFFLTAGFFVGSSELVTLDGQFDMNDPNIKQIQQAGLMKDIELEVGDDVIRATADGHMAAALKVNGFRPYIGLGWGRAIPKHRFGFRFEFGAQFYGHPEIVSDNLVSKGSKSELSDVNETLDKIIALPRLSLQLTYKLFKDK